MRTLSMVLMAAVVMTVGTVSASTNAIPWRLQKYSLTARAMNVREALETFGVAEGIPVLMSDAVTGTVSGTFKNEPATRFLDRLATVNNLVWYYDGATLYVYGSSETLTTLIDLKYLKAEDLGALLGELGVEDSRFPIKSAQNGELILVSGPPRYVQLVSELIARADNLREQRTFNEVEVRLFPLTYTWADNVTISVTTPESSVTIKGIAAMLAEITRADGAERALDGTNSVDRAGEQNARRNQLVKPIITPENRLNAVVVRDVKTRMPMYDRLIRDLDRPIKLVEITITTLELSKEDAFEWQNSLSIQGGRERKSETHSAGGGMNVDNLMSSDSLSGKGLSTAYSYVGDHVSISASISALKAKDKTRSISRTSILTLNNFAASITDTQTYNARVVGEKVASLESVSAGTTFRAKPRAVKGHPTNDYHNVWLTLEVQDGGFTAQSVDGMPMTRTTTLVTQTMLAEGQSLVLAGYMRDVEAEASWGIPFLRDLPIIGWLFGGTSDSTETVQRMFVLTPRVIETIKPETPADQTTHLRDTTLPEKLTGTMEADDDRRRVRREDVDEARTIERERAEDLLKLRRAEIERDARDRELEREKADEILKGQRREWEEDFERRDEAYRLEKAAREAAAEKAEREAAENAKRERK